MPPTDPEFDSEYCNTAVADGDSTSGCALMIFALCSGIALIILACRIVFPG